MSSHHPHHTSLIPAKLGFVWRSWHQARFFPAVLSRSTISKSPCAPREEIAPSTQVWKVWNRRNKDGFTITELVLSITVSMILIGVLYTTTFFYFVDTMQSQTATDLALDSQTILTQLTEDIRLSDAISSTNALADANSPVGGWATSDPSNIIIIESPAVDSNHNIIYNNNSGYPYRNEYIYFMSGTNMYKRVLANATAIGNTIKTTCPLIKSTPACPPDRIFSSRVSNLSFTFYDASDNTTADATKARSVTLKVDMAKKAYGKNVTLSNSTRVTLRNQ